MKVLLLSLFHPELVRGGAQQICYELFEGLKATADVEPFLLAAIDPTFGSFYKAGARITGFDGRKNEFLYLSRDYDYIWHKTSDSLLIEAYAEFLESLRPDVVHFHHFLLFGIDFISLTRRVLPRARLVFTFHEFMAICAADGQLVRLTDQSICNRASPVRCHQCFPDHGPDEFFLRELWMKRHLGVVDRFTTPSRFMVKSYVDWGLPRARIRHIPNGQRDHSDGTQLMADRNVYNRFGFFGQFVDNKGVHLILEAVSLLRGRGFTAFSVELNGDNLKYASASRRAELEAILTEEAARPPESRIVNMAGSYQVDQLGARMRRVDWCLVPSTWPEAFGLVISEAWMFGKPVIGSNVGAMAERIRHEQDGLLFEAGDARALAETMQRACTTPGLWASLAAELPKPPTRRSMVEGFLEVYREAEE